VQHSMQSDLKNEFDNLIKEITLEIMELSLSKAMVDAAHTVKVQIPEIEKYIVDLNKTASKLDLLRKELEGQVLDIKESYERFAKEVSDLNKKVEILSEDVKKTINSIVEFREEMSHFRLESIRNYENLERSMSDAVNKSNDNHQQVIEDLKEVIATMDEDSLLAKGRGKIQLTAMFFSMGSFFALCYIIYSQL
ncbi:hypothetical protein, partial [Paenisporosarcina sp.]|uniref:hypothetical protein n=1 Tax=Paenisporosarcina sp. TaxID=1932001 RepID=UPI003C718DBB